MIKKKLFLQIFFAFLFTVLLLFMVVWVYLSGLIERGYQAEQTRLLTLRERHLRPVLQRSLAAPGDVNVTKQLSQLLNSDITNLSLVDSQGKIIANAVNTYEVGKAFTDFAFFEPCLSGHARHQVDFDNINKKRILQVATPVCDANGKPQAVLIATCSFHSARLELNTIFSELLASTAIFLLLSAAISLFLARKISAPLRQLQQAADSYKIGNFAVRLPLYDIEEIDKLAMALNLMSIEIQKRLKTLTDKNSEINAILSSMLEGVLALDKDGNIININDAAKAIFDIHHNIENQPVWGAIRHKDIHTFIDRILQQSKKHKNGADSPLKQVFETEIVFQRKTGKGRIKLRGTELEDADKKTIGVLLMINDITKMYKLENLRRDFVANVSHEVKTPLTAIKGSVETLLSGAIDNKRDAKHFMKIIMKHTDRLNNLIEDILSLSKVEESGEQNAIQITDASVRDLLNNAVDLCRHKAESNKVELIMRCPQDLTVKFNSAMMEQVLVNLIDNAIKHSQPGAKVEVEASLDGQHLVIHVKDNGCGIAANHIPRLFERFYRVDKARSRKLGGTGLGLAIVKHIVHAHKGKIDVSSEVGKGSTFTVSIPAG